MPRGGARPGAGRNPKERGVVLGMDGARIPDPLPPATSVDASTAPTPTPGAPINLLTPPADLTASQQAYWSAYAPHAIEQRTLVQATIAGFRELCEQSALKKVIADRIEKVGAASKRAEPHLKTYVKLSQRVDATLARFKLTSFGKPADAKPGAAKAANPWAQVGT